jgi:Meiotically up-regulated gene 113
MLFFLSKRLPMGFRAGVAFDPTKPINREVRPGGSIAAFGDGVCGVYVITGAHNMCKIGISTDPELRLAALQTGSHVPLKLHYVLVLKTIDPRAVEVEAHRILDKHRCAGEWFDVTPEIAEAAVNRAAANLGVGILQADGVASRKRWSGEKLYWAISVPAVILFVLWLNWPKA